MLGTLPSTHFKASATQLDMSGVYSALQLRAGAAAAGNGSSSSSSGDSDFAWQFSEAVIKFFNPPEVQAVLNFLDPVKLMVKDGASLLMLEEFSEEEYRISQQDSRELVRYSGPLNAGVGVMLHIKHYEPEQEDTFVAGPLWNPSSPSIQVLKDKGFSDDFTLGSDWHWRAAVKDDHCAFKRRGAELRAVHNTFSLCVLDLVPCPLLVVGGACAWESYIKSTWDCSSRNSFMSEGVEVQFAFEFIESDTGPRVLRRIAASVDHPSFAWRCHPDSAVTVARRFDKQAEFMLWLSGWNFAANSHELKTPSGKRSGRSGSAPLKELWGYRDRERKLGAFLRKDSFYQPFLY